MMNAICRRGLYLLVLALLLFIDDSVAQQEDATSGTKRVTLAFTNAPVKTILKSIQRQTGLRFLGTQSQSTRMSIQVNGATVSAVLMEYFATIGYTWRWKDEGKIILYEPPADWLAPPVSRPVMRVSSSVTVTGTVTDETFLPLPGITIQVRGEKAGTNTDTAGRFQLHVSHEDAVLEVRSLGYETRRVPLAGQKHLAIQLKPSDKFLDEVVITGYGRAAKRFLTGAVSQVALKPTRQVGTSNLLTSLQALVPGLVIVQTSGVPGSMISVQLRGRNSVMNLAAPLFVVNGIPYIGGYPAVNLRPSISSQNVNGGISSFELQIFGEIESIVVLKDADATAIYGSRGANGVVLIETKRGNPGECSLDATLVRGWGEVASKYSLFNTEQYLTMRHEALRNDRLTPGTEPGTINFTPDLTLWDPIKYTDWQKELLGKTANTTDLNLALSFGTQRMQVRIGGNHYRETTVFDHDLFYSRTGLNLLVDHANKDSSFLISTYGIYSTDQYCLYNGSVKAVFTPPNAPAVRGEHNSLLWEPGLQHPFADFLKTYQLFKRNYLLSTMVQVRPVKNFLLKANLGFSGLNTNEYDQLPIASQNPELSPSGSATQAGKNIWGYIVEPLMEYNARFVPGDLTVVAGASFQHTSTTNTILTGEGYKNDADLSELGKAAYYSTNIMTPSDYDYAAIFGQLKYQWKQKYIASLSLRRDASSRFSPSKNSGNFWSIGAAWIFSEEPFSVNHLPWLYFGKFRGSIGLTGSDLVDDNGYQAVWASNPSNNPYQGVRGISPQAPFNPGFSWELCLKKEIALDYALFSGRVQGSFSYYHNKSTNQLVQAILPAQLGFSSMLRNSAGEILNTGFEMMLTAHLIRSGAVHLQLSGNLSLPRNKLVAFDNLEYSAYYGSLLLNEPVTVLNKLKSDGLGTDGLYKIKDLDGIQGYNVGDYVKVGVRDPELLAGFELNLSWKWITLNAVLDVRKQMGFSYLYPMLLANLYPGGLSNQSTDLLNRYQQVGDEGKKYQKISTLPAGAINGNATLVLNSDLAFANTSYYKLRVLGMNITLPKKLLSTVHCKQATVFFTGRNLFTISDYAGGDPEVGNVLSLSTMKVLSVGLKLSM